MELNATNLTGSLLSTNLTTVTFHGEQLLLPPDISPIQSIACKFRNELFICISIHFTVPIVEFLRKRYIFRQSQGSVLIPVRRSHSNGILALHWTTNRIFGTEQQDSLSEQLDQQLHSDPYQAERDQIIGEDIDWGSGRRVFCLT